MSDTTPEEDEQFFAGREREHGRIVRFLQAEAESWRTIGKQANAALVDDLVGSIQRGQHRADRFEEWGEG